MVDFFYVFGIASFYIRFKPKQDRDETASLGTITCQYDEFISGEPHDKIENAN